MAEKKEKGFILSSLENFWYYYKWPFLGGIVIAIAVVVGVFMFADVEEPSDADIVTVFSSPLTMQELDFESRLKDVISDTDGDGNKSISTASVYITKSGEGDQDATQTARFEYAISYAQGDLVLLDGANYERFCKKDFLAPLEDFISIAQIDEADIKRRDGVPVMVKLSDSKVLLDMQFVTDDVYAGIMFVPEESSEQCMLRRKNAANMLMKLLEK